MLFLLISRGYWSPLEELYINTPHTSLSYCYSRVIQSSTYCLHFVSIRISVKTGFLYSMIHLSTRLYQLMPLHLHYTMSCIFAYVNQIFVTAISWLTSADIKMEHSYSYCNAEAQSNSINERYIVWYYARHSDTCTYTVYLSIIWRVSSVQIVEDPSITVNSNVVV